jgi:hypothetical protein
MWYEQRLHALCLPAQQHDPRGSVLLMSLTNNEKILLLGDSSCKMAGPSGCKLADVD